MRIRTKLFLIILFSGLSPLIFSFLVLIYSLNNYWLQTTKQNLYNSLYNLKTIIEKEMTKYRDYTSFIGYNISINEYLKNYNKRTFHKYINDNIIKACNKENIRIFEITKKEKIIYKDVNNWDESKFFTTDEMASFIWKYLSNPFYTTYFNMSFPYIYYNIVVMKNCVIVTDSKKNEKLGIAIISTPLDEHFLSDITINFPDSIFYIKNSNGVVFSRIDFDLDEMTEYIIKNKNKKKFEQIRLKKSGTFFNYCDTLFTFTTKENNKIKTINIADIGILTKNNAFLEQRKIILRTAFLWFIIGLCGILLISFIFGSNIAIPIIDLANNLSNFSNNLKPFDYNNSKINDEISILYKKYSEMTHQIINDRNQLEIQRLNLKKRNEIIENDLSLARKIQLSYLPEKNKFYNIAFIYKPMDKIGGDFFDFIQYKNTNSLGIFLSDVSGHGVASALITSMIKNNLIQIAPNIYNPSYFLNNLNNSLYKQTAGNFVTAFFGIFNYDNNEFLYSNAGHNLPYIITFNDIFLLPSYNSSIPLAIFDNNELKTLNREYKNEKIKLEIGTKILFYTDGFTEAIPTNTNDNYIDFERDKLLDSILSYRNLSANEFVNELYNDLVEYRGSEEFDDDVCIICLEII